MKLAKEDLQGILLYMEHHYYKSQENRSLEAFKLLTRLRIAIRFYQ